MKFVFQLNGCVLDSVPGVAIACVGVAVWDDLGQGRLGGSATVLSAGHNRDHVLAVLGWSPPTQPTCQKAEYEGKYPDRTNRIEDEKRSEHGPFFPLVDVIAIDCKFSGSAVQVYLACAGFVTIGCRNAFREEFPIRIIAVKFFLGCAFSFLIHLNVNNSSLLI